MIGTPLSYAHASYTIGAREQLKKKLQFWKFNLKNKSVRLQENANSKHLCVLRVGRGCTQMKKMCTQTYTNDWHCFRWNWTILNFPLLYTFQPLLRGKVWHTNEKNLYTNDIQTIHKRLAQFSWKSDRLEFPLSIDVPASCAWEGVEHKRKKYVHKRLTPFLWKLGHFWIFLFCRRSSPLYGVRGCIQTKKCVHEHTQMIYKRYINDWHSFHENRTVSCAWEGVAHKRKKICTQTIDTIFVEIGPFLNTLQPPL